MNPIDRDLWKKIGSSWARRFGREEKEKIRTGLGKTMAGRTKSTEKVTSLLDAAMKLVEDDDDADML